MLTKTRRTTIHFCGTFSLPGVDIVFPPGDYVIVEYEELVDGLNFAAHRPMGTFFEVPAIPLNAGATRMFQVDLSDLESALWHDIANMDPNAKAIPAT